MIIVLERGTTEAERRDVLQRLEGAMVFLGVRPPGTERPAPCHSNRMVLDEDGMGPGMALHAAVALRWLGA